MFDSTILLDKIKWSSIVSGLTKKWTVNQNHFAIVWREIHIFWLDVLYFSFRLYNKEESFKDSRISKLVLDRHTTSFQRCYNVKRHRVLTGPGGQAAFNEVYCTFDTVPPHFCAKKNFDQFLVNSLLWDQWMLNSRAHTQTNYFLFIKSIRNFHWLRMNQNRKIDPMNE